MDAEAYKTYSLYIRTALKNTNTYKHYYRRPRILRDTLAVFASSKTDALPSDVMNGLWRESPSSTPIHFQYGSNKTRFITTQRLPPYGALALEHQSQSGDK